MINIGFGLLLNFSHNVTGTFQYGSFLELVYAALLLPILPKISPHEYFNAMSLSSAWKFGILGLAILLGTLKSSFLLTQVTKC